MKASLAGMTALFSNALALVRPTHASVFRAGALNAAASDDESWACFTRGERQ